MQRHAPIPGCRKQRIAGAAPVLLQAGPEARAISPSDDERQIGCSGLTTSVKYRRPSNRDPRIGLCHAGHQYTRLVTPSVPSQGDAGSRLIRLKRTPRPVDGTRVRSIHYCTMKRLTGLTTTVKYRQTVKSRSSKRALRKASPPDRQRRRGSSKRALRKASPPDRHPLVLAYVLTELTATLHRLEMALMG